MRLREIDASFVPRGKRRGIMDEEEEEEDVGSMLSSLSGEEDKDSSNSVGSSSSDFVEDATSSSSSSSSNSIGGDDDHPGGGAGPLFEMSSLISHLPFKRGISKHFQGKSQSFTLLADVRSLEDLVKPERPFRKKLKSSRSYAGGLDSHKGCCSRAISKKGSRGRFSSLSSKRQQHSFLGSRPPVPPHRSGSFSLHAVAYSPQNISSSVLGDDVQRCSNCSGDLLKKNLCSMLADILTLFSDGLVKKLAKKSAEVVEASRNEAKLMALANGCVVDSLTELKKDNEGI